MNKFKYIAVIILVILMLSNFALAETATRIPLTINIVEGCDVSDEEINAVVEEANQIMKRYMISYEVKKVNRNVAGAGSDGKITSTEEHGLVTGAMNEIRQSDGSYKGMKVFYGNELREPNYYGMAYHADNGGQWYSVPVVFMKKRPGTTQTDYKEKGNDLAHELAHSLTLVGKKPVAGSLAGESDNWGHMTNPLDSDNLMYQYNGGTPPTRVVRGGNLAPEQIKEIKENAKRFGKNYVVTPSDEFYKAMHPQNEIIYNHEPRTLWVDNPAETYTLDLYNDLAFGYIYAESVTAGMMDIVINLAGAFPAGLPVNTQICINMDTDNNITTGSSLGFDKSIIIDLLEIYPTVNTMAAVHNIDGTLIDFVPIAFLEQTKALCDVSDPDLLAQSQIQPFTDTVFIQFPSHWLDITADQIPVTISLHNNLTPADDETSFIFETTAQNEPHIFLESNVITPTDSIIITGSNYTPDEPVEIYLDDDLIFAAIADSEGCFFAELPYPAGLEFGRYFISARDTTRRISDFGIITLIHLAGDIDFNHSVNLEDIVYIAQNWLFIE